MANTKFENATTWLQGVISGYQKQINDFSAVPNPDANKIKACKERQELCQYILDFMVKAKQHNDRSEEHTSELQSVRISYAVFCLKKKKKRTSTFETLYTRFGKRPYGKDRMTTTKESRVLHIRV